MSAPRISVIIPTYNRAQLLAATLRQLERQRLPRDEFEVIVADDGSGDATRDVVRSFSSRLRLRYHFQEDEGFRAGTARTAGARLADGELLVFLDTGAIANADLLTAHLAAHRDGRRAVLGYAYGFNPDLPPLPGLAEALATLPPEEVLGRFAASPDFRDVREREFRSCEYDLSRRTVPWMLFFTINCSVRAADFWTVGGFDESYRGWGVEDLDFGYRLHRSGVATTVSRDAWVIESPHPRNMAANLAEFAANMEQFVARHPVPVIELGAALIADGRFWEWEEQHRRLLDWSDRARTADVSAEVAETLRALGPGRRVAVLGAGDAVPQAAPSAILVDFDDSLLARGARRAGRQAHHAIGLGLPLVPGEVDTIVATSRLAGLYEQWGDHLAAEARRIAPEFHIAWSALPG